MKKILVMLAAVLMAAAVTGQTQEGSPKKMLSSKQLMNRNLHPSEEIDNVQFVGNSDKIAYVKDHSLYMGKPGSEKVVLTRERLNQILNQNDMKSLSALPTFKMESESEVRFAANGKMLRLKGIGSSKNGKETLEVLTVCERNLNGLKWEQNSGAFAYNEDNALVVCDKDGKEITRFAPENPDIVIGQSVHRNEFGIDGGIFWSPKGNKLAFYRMDQSMVTDYPMVNTNSRIATPAPFKYPMAGMKSHEVTIGVYDLASGKEIYLNTRKDTSVAEREMYLTNVTWSPDGQYIYVAKVNRAQNHDWIERYNATTGNLDKVLFEEENERYVEPCEGLYFLPGTSEEFLWFSMRDGYKHLYQYRTDGSLVRQLTHGAYEVEGVIGFTPDGKYLFVYANKDNLIGKAAYRVDMTTGDMIRVTPAEGTHEIAFNAKGNRIIDIYNSVNIPGRIDVLDIDGKCLATLSKSINPLHDYAMPDIKMGTIKAADGKTDLYYRLITPPDMNPEKQYPTLVYVYGGPHSQLVTDSWLGGGNLYFTYLAQQGYIVFTVDNRGTDNRGFEFESCTHRQLGTIEMADQMEGVKFLKSLPYVDQNRMGVEGWSFGGFMTITMKLAHPEIFKVGCAGGPVIDWKWYEVMYGERYMDTPQENPEGYEHNALTGKAGDLQGRLLVIHGAEDNTVVWQNSIEFIQACIKNGKLVDYFIYPHHEHNVRGYDRIHLYEKMFDYYETFLK